MTIVTDTGLSSASRPRLKVPQEIEDFLLYRLCRVAEAALRGTDEMYKRELGISRREWRILAYLVRIPDGSLKALAADAGLDVGVASRCVAEMHGRGLLSKERSAANRRLVCLKLTSLGYEVHGRAKAMAAAYNREFANCLTDAEAAMTLCLLDKLERHGARLTRRH